VRLSRRLELRVDPDLVAGLDTFAQRHALTRGAAARLLLARRLDAQGRENQDDQVSLAALVASEHVLQMLEVLFPGGRDRSQALRGLAAEAAERRLTEVGGEALA
jgi:hypothetical protein